MSLVNFSLPYQSATMVPFFYTGSDRRHTIANNLRLNAVLPSSSVPSSYEQETFHNEPYVSTIKYRQHQQRRQSTQQRSPEVHTEHSPFSSTQHTSYAEYNQDFRRIQPRQQQQMRPSSSSFQQQHIHSSEPDKSRIEKQDNYPERSNR